MFIQKKIELKNLTEINLLDELYCLDRRYDGPRWMYTRSELAKYIVYRSKLVKMIEEQDGKPALDKYRYIPE